MNNGTRTILTLVTGAVAGAVTALLLAPQTGTETRRAIGRSARRAKDQIGETLQQGLDKISNLTGMSGEEVKSELGEMYGSQGAPGTGRRQSSSRPGGSAMPGSMGSGLGSTGRSGQGSIGNV